MVKGKSECTISGLDPSTTYEISVIRVQTIGTTITIDEQKIIVTTMSAPPPTPVVSISGGDGITEGGSASFTLTSVPPPTSPITVSVTISASGDFSATTGSRSVTIPIGGSATFTVATTNDSTDEADGSVTATLVDGSNYDLGAVNIATVNVADDDGPPAISISGGGNVTEGSPVTFTVSATPAPTANLVVSLTITTTGDFGVTAGSRTVTIDSGTSSVTLSLPTTNDTTDEANGSVTATLVDGTDYDLGAVKTATVTVADDEPTPVVSIAASSGVIIEGAAVIFTVSATPAPTADLEVSLTITTSGDYGVTAGDRTVTIMGGATSATLTLPTTNDSNNEPDGAVAALLVDGTGYALGNTTLAAVSVADDDGPPAIGISAGSEVAEGSPVTFTFSALPAPTANLIVTLKITTKGDFGITDGDRTVTFANGATSATLSIPTTNDSTDELNGSVTATLIDGTDYDLRAFKIATVNVFDDDRPPEKPYTTTSKTGGGIMISDTMDQRWRPYIYEGNAFSPFDHLMGESEHVTYQVSVPADACPATVEISGGPRYYLLGSHPENRNLEIIAGSAPPSTRATPPGPKTISATLRFTSENCASPQSVTVYGLPDIGFNISQRGSYVILTHTLTKDSDPNTEITGPEFKVWAFDRYGIYMGGAVPEAGGVTPVTNAAPDGNNIDYVNDVGPAWRAGRKFSGSYLRWSEETTYVQTSRPPDTTAMPPTTETMTEEEQYTEFCIAVHPGERAVRTAEGVVFQSRNGVLTIPLEQFTLIPFTYLDRFWYRNGDRWLHRVDHGGFTLPFEIQRYSSIVNPGRGCRPVASTDTGSWKTVYSGGPRTNNKTSYDNWKSKSVEPFVINWRDWGEYVNVRIRTVYAVEATKPDTPTFRAPPGSLRIKFAFAEILSAWSVGSIVLDVD